MPFRAIPLASLFVVCLAIPRPAQAQTFDLSVARRALAHYDVRGDGTLDVIRQLGQLLARPSGRREAREAGFLRDMAAADLLVLDPSAGMRQRVGRALGVPSDDVLPWLRADLARAGVGPYRSAAAEGLGALALREATEPDYQSTRGPRRDALYLATVVEALQASDPVPALSRLMPDPCPQLASCEGALLHFQASGRRAVAALVESRAAVGRLHQAAEGGDPFARSAVEDMAATTARLDAAELSPAPRLPDGTTLPAVPESEAAMHVDVVLLVSDRQLLLGYAARVRVGEDGVLSLSPTELPLLPETRTFRLPAGYRPSVSEIPALRRALPRAPEGAMVALGVAPEVPAHVMSRVFLSARAAGIEPGVLLGRASQGGIRGVAFHGVVSGEAVPASELRVQVRLGGYAVAPRQGASVSLPRVRGDEGLEFDLAGLSQLVNERGPESASLRFMSVVDSGPVLRAAFGLDAAVDGLTVVMP